MSNVVDINIVNVSTSELTKWMLKIHKKYNFRYYFKTAFLMYRNMKSIVHFGN